MTTISSNKIIDTDRTQNIFTKIIKSIWRKIALICTNPKLATLYSFLNLAYFLKLPISGSQYGEDLILDYLIRKPRGFYVDIGANDPFFGSNTYLFHCKGRNGITVEPNKYLHKKMCKHRPKATNLNLAVGGNGILTYYEMDLHGLSTCDRKIMETYTQKGHNLINTYDIKVIGLGSIFDKYLNNGQYIDILSLDVEGMEIDVLESNDREKYKPEYIILETVLYQGQENVGIKNDKKYTDYLKKYGYKVIADTYVNTIYKCYNYV